VFLVLFKNICVQYTLLRRQFVHVYRTVCNKFIFKFDVNISSMLHHDVSKVLLSKNLVEKLLNDLVQKNIVQSVKDRNGLFNLFMRENS
jgi:hypothetical protein